MAPTAQVDIDDATSTSVPIDAAFLRASLTTMLRQEGRLDADEEVDEVVRLIGGYSREMWTVKIKDGAGTAEYILRQDPPPRSTMLVSDRAAEWELMNAIARSGAVNVPRPLWADTTGAQLGRPSIVMERIPGKNLLMLWREEADDERDPAAWAEAAAGVARLMASYTRFDLAHAPSSLDRPDSWEAYMDGCSRRWREAEAAYTESIPLVRHIAAWLDAHRPAPAPLSLVHADMQPNNILVDAADGRYLAVDWELGHIGDPREDLGWWLLCEHSQHATFVSANLERFMEVYRQETGLGEDVINEPALRYFMVASSLTCYEDLLEQAATLTAGETTAPGVAYIASALPFMHGVFARAIQAFDDATAIRQKETDQ